MKNMKNSEDTWEFIHRIDTLAIQKQKEEIERLQAEVERLRKAGDAMAEQIYNEGKVRGITFMSNVYEWNAAKEGKPSV